MKEEWRDIPGYEGYYQVSNLGRVKSFHLCGEHILKNTKSVLGYYLVNLCKEGKSKTKTIHRIVASAFIYGYSENIEIDHIDKVKTNNNIENLRLATSAQNSANIAKKQGTSSKYKGVSFNKNAGKWHAQIRHNGKRKHIGYFNNEIDAAVEYDKMANKLKGEYAYTNKLSGLLDD